MKPIAERISPPIPDEVRQARRAAGLTQAQAAQLVAVSHERAERTWQNYEAAVGKAAHRDIPLAAWELFLLMTGQHPTLKVQPRTAA